VNGPEARGLESAVLAALDGPPVDTVPLPNEVFAQLRFRGGSAGSTRYCVLGMAPIGQYLAMATVCRGGLESVGQANGVVVDMLTAQAAAIDAARQ
jgi:hypothetical protein